MIHPSIHELSQHDTEMAKEAHAWKEALGHARDATSARAVAHRALRYANEHVLPHMHEEERILNSVVREHVGVAPLVAREKEAMEKVVADCRRVAQDVQSGADCRASVNTLADDLHAMARFEAQEYYPWAKQALGDRLLREADARWQAYGKTRAQPRYAGIYELWAS